MLAHLKTNNFIIPAQLVTEISMKEDKEEESAVLVDGKLFYKGEGGKCWHINNTILKNKVQLSTAPYFTIFENCGQNHLQF